MKKQSILTLSLTFLTLFATGSGYSAQAQTVTGHAYRYNKPPTYFQRHPYQKTGLVGAGVGAGAGALAGGLLFGDKSTVKMPSGVLSMAVLLA